MLAIVLWRTQWWSMTDGGRTSLVITEDSLPVPTGTIQVCSHSNYRWKQKNKWFYLFLQTFWNCKSESINCLFFFFILLCFKLKRSNSNNFFKSCRGLKYLIISSKLMSMFVLKTFDHIFHWGFGNACCIIQKLIGVVFMPHNVCHSILSWKEHYSCWH